MYIHIYICIYIYIYIYTSRIPALRAGFPASSCGRQRALWAQSLPRFARQTNPPFGRDFFGNNNFAFPLSSKV